MEDIAWLLALCTSSSLEQVFCNCCPHHLGSGNTDCCCCDHHQFSCKTCPWEMHLGKANQNLAGSSSPPASCCRGWT